MRTMQYHFEHVFSIIFFFFSYELFISDQSQRVYSSNDKSSDDELGKIRKEKTEETEDERERRKKKRRGNEEQGGSSSSSSSHRQWWVESNHIRPISLPFKRFHSSLQYSWHELVIITAKQVSVVCVCGRSRPLSSGIEGTARLCSLTKLEGEY